MSSSSAVSPSEYAVGSTDSAERSTRSYSSFLSAYTSVEYLKDKLPGLLTAESLVWDQEAIDRVVNILSTVAMQSENTVGRTTAIVVLSAMADDAFRQSIQSQASYLGAAGSAIVTALTWLRDGDSPDDALSDLQWCFLQQLVVELPSIVSEYEKALQYSSHDEPSVIEWCRQVVITFVDTMKTSFGGIKVTPASEVRQRYAKQLKKQKGHSGTTRQGLREHAQHQQAKIEAEAEASTQSKKKQKQKPRHKPPPPKKSA